ncbi:DUF4253 domain-containing protein [Streptomyces mobaraensis]|uniref:DUF4253 domain-containing protein n=1 Tax=Streptomyces mobaraensis TaxID=35621 RepID=A0A5N5W2L3_STRMB|nr:DUF4253 domain-containing protein [Streptomyces mobaraensis]KAB7835515.1 DUF4253 domain-containing protein [Streptomyces mobaraensis]
MTAGQLTKVLSGRVAHLLPPGRIVPSGEGDGDVEALWLSDGPAAAELWTRLHAEHNRSGLWPLLLDALDPDDGDFRLWGSGEVFPEQMSSPARHDAAGLLAQWWGTYASPDPDGEAIGTEERLSVTAPFGQAWPGLAPVRKTAINPDHLAAEFAQAFLAHHPQARLGPVAATSGAEALTVAGWAGPCNFDDTAKFSTVAQDWEHRFGARVVAVGFDTLHLSVASPPTLEREALLVAAEHFAFCPDNIWQGSAPYTLAAYAEQITGAHRWDFWWD